VVHRDGGRELRIGGTFASWYEPGSPVTGSVWDALAVGLLALPRSRRRSVLLLGLGGGSAARLSRALAPAARIVGVEIDPQVVRLARRHFGLDAIGVEVVLADARDYLQRSGERFDAILEDVFESIDGEARKPAGFPEPAFDHALRALRPGGVLASNTLDEAPSVARALARRRLHGVRIGIEGYDNRVYVASRLPLGARPLRAAVAAEPLLGETLPRLRFRSLGPREP